MGPLLWRMGRFSFPRRLLITFPSLPLQVQTPLSYTGPKFSSLGTRGVTSPAETTSIRSLALLRRSTVGSTCRAFFISSPPKGIDFLWAANILATILLAFSYLFVFSITEYKISRNLIIFSGRNRLFLSDGSWPWTGRRLGWSG